MSLAYATKQSKKYLTIKSLIKSLISIGTVTVLVSRKFATHARVVPGQSSIMIAARYSTARNVRACVLHSQKKSAHIGETHLVFVSHFRSRLPRYF